MASAGSTNKGKDKKKAKKDKGKDKAISSVFIDDAADADRPEDAYQPPAGSVRLTNIFDSEGFDYDALKDDDDFELWIIRVPDGVKPKHLAELSLPIPSSSETSHLGTLSRKHTTYDIWSVRDEGSDQTAIAGGDEVLGLNCLMPRKKKDGKLYCAPKPIARHLVVSVQPALPTPPLSSPDVPSSISFKSPARYRHPKHLLKHRFLPCGAVHESPATTAASIEIDQAIPKDAFLEGTDKSPRKEHGEKKSSPSKKRKGEGEIPKKLKKAKIGS